MVHMESPGTPALLGRMLGQRDFRPFSTTERGITNLKTDYKTTDTSLQDGEKMVYFGPQTNT